MSTLEAVQSRLYLDVDGVILPFARPDAAELPFEMKPANGLEYYSPDVVSRLGNTCLSLVWCTTWEEKGLKELVESMGALCEGRQLELPSTIEGVTRISQKLDAIVADQVNDPAPFVWVDDGITDDERQRVVNIFMATPHLIIQPDKMTGINQIQLSLIESFAARFEHTA
jgi:hypothetical protein